MSASLYIESIAAFALENGLICEEDRLYTINRLMECMAMEAPDADVAPGELIKNLTLTPMLEGLCDIAVQNGIIADSGESRELFSARLAGCVTPSPYEVRQRFASMDSMDALKWFYEMCRACDYIKVDRINKNLRYFAAGLEITINLSKPEKDPRDIEAAKKRKSVSYPKCHLCLENPGYAGRIGFPARQNHRIVPITLGGEPWHIQFSPYLYYNEHCIVFSDVHRDMAISKAGFGRLFDFVDIFPGYFLGSNADLPIVGGSILTHDHFQGGSYEFPMDKAADEIRLTTDVPGIDAAIIDWPLSCVRLTGRDRAALIDKADEILSAWRGYSDESLGIYAETYAPHNTITPILRKNGDTYCLNLVLRNNRKDEAHELGIFHPHSDLHHIKKENIGLIEVMGLMILPGRLLKELAEIEKCLTGEATPEALSNKAHADWTNELIAEFGTSLSAEAAQKAVREGVGKKCRRVLSDAGVYKQDPEGREGFRRFLKTTGIV